MAITAEEGNQQEDGHVMANRFTSARNLTGFWLLGLCNNFAYVVMLTAASDILEDKPDTKHNETNSTTAHPFVLTHNDSHKLVEHCNKIGTGAILLADILPTLLIKITAPLYLMKVPYIVRVLLVVLFSALSFPIVSFSYVVALSLLGVVFASASGGLGEISFLSLSTYFHKDTVSTWSSGTGASGIGGALSYAGLTAIGLTPRVTLMIMLVIPALLAVSYFIILVKPRDITKPLIVKVIADHETSGLLDDSEDLQPENDTGTRIAMKLILKEKLSVSLGLMKYIVPLMAVYFAEYFINQALFELLYFENIWLSIKQQYRWYQVLYQIGVFISRSSVNIISVRRTWIVALLQFVNLFVLLLQVFLRFIPNIWIILQLFSGKD